MEHPAVQAMTKEEVLLIFAAAAAELTISFAPLRVVSSTHHPRFFLSLSPPPRTDDAV
eukprot:SAG22_NODE_143_length_17909_cov_34.254969_11_plen_58_part_00